MTYLPFAQLDWSPLFEDHGIPLAIMGLVVVFAALTLVRIFIGLLPRIIAILDQHYPEPSQQLSSPRPEPAAAPPVVESPTGKSADEEIAVAIAAAVVAMLETPHRILHTREPTPEEMNWTLAGRRQHHASHRIQPRNRD